MRDAEQMGRLIAQRAGMLVFGGNAVGCMKVVADGCKDAGGKVVGVTPRMMDEKGISYGRADELIVTETMRERKAVMEERADAFVAMAGGFGTLEELLEILTGKHLGYHGKAIVLLNTAGFYDPLIEMFEHVYRQKFAKEVYRSYYHVAGTPVDVMDYLEAYKAPAKKDKWL